MSTCMHTKRGRCKSTPSYADYRTAINELARKIIEIEKEKQLRQQADTPSLEVKTRIDPT